MGSSETSVIISTMQPLAIVAIAVVGFILVFRTKSKKRPLDYYTNPDWNYFLKKWWAQRIIRKYIKEEQKSSLKELKQEEIEQPRPLETESMSDSQFVFGQDPQGNSLMIKITRRRHRIAEVWLVLRLSDGRTFTLPDHPDTQVFNVRGESFNGAGLSMECLRPFVSWRIRFNGLLREGVRSEWEADLKEHELTAVKFNFLWSTKSKPLYWPYDWSTQLMASSLATEPWRDGDWMKLLAKADSGGYDQYGAMKGEIFISAMEDDEYFEVNLPGVRQRRWGPTKVAHLRRTGSIIGVCRDGMVFVIGAFSSKANLTHAQFGNVIFPNGQFSSIDWTDFHLRDFGEYRSLKDAQHIRFAVGKRQFSVLIHVKQSTKVSLFGGRPLDWHTDCYQMEMTVNGEDGRGIGLFWYPSEGSETPLIPHVPRYRRVHYASVKPKANKFVYHFAEEEASSVQISGGKGASLALLTSISRMGNVIDRFYSNDQLFKDHRHEHLSTTRKQSIAQQPGPEFTVPPGFVLSVSAMELMVVRNPDLNSAIDKLVALCENGQNFEEQCGVVKWEMENLKLSNQIQEDVIKALKVIREECEDIRIAVRSSSVCEDGEDVSAAGQNETFLGLRSEEEILEAIKRCWASLFTYQSVQYRRQNIQPIRTGMGVVVQVMLPSECAGVLFSQHPITGNPKQCLISANFGLGESVVSGEIDPDNFIVQRNYRDDGFFLAAKTCGKKGYKIQMADNETVEKVNVESVKEFCVPDEVVLKLAEIGVVLEKLYGNGRDIEWGLKENRIYLLQSRPITSFNQFSDWELIHEFDGAIMSEEDLFTTANLQEVLPGALSPLGNHYLIPALEKAFLDQIEGKSDETPRFASLFVTTRHQVHMEVIGCFFRNNSQEVRVDQRIVALAVFGHDFINDRIHQLGLKRNPSDSTLSLKMTLAIIKSCWRVKRVSKEAAHLAKSFQSQYSTQNLVYFRTAHDLFANMEQHFPLIYKIATRHSNTSSVSTFYNMITMIVLTGGAKALSEEHHNDFRLILGSAKNTESADVPKKLEEMAREIFLSGKKVQFCEIDPDSGAKWLEKNVPEVYKIFSEFIELNKHRGYKEFDLATVTWGMNSGIIIGMLQSILKYTESVDALTKHNDLYSLSPSELVKSLKSAKTKFAKSILKKTITLSHKAVQYRELSKSNFISIMHEFRLGFRHLGQLMTREGYLPKEDLVFYLTGAELKHLLKTKDVELVKKAIRRQKLLADLNKDKYPELIFGVPTPVNIRKKIQFESGTELRGTPVYAGVVTGRACVIHDFSEVSKIQPGDILITHSTDIGWSPYFPILGGVVTELGGLISHGAVVAREYGLPCLVAAENATQFFAFGEIITLDAKSGVIFKGSGN